MHFMYCPYCEGATEALVPAYKYVFTFRPSWWMITVAVCTVVMVVETTVKGAFVESGENA